MGVGHVFGPKWMFGYFEPFSLMLFVCFSVIEARGRPRGVKKPRGPVFLEIREAESNNIKGRRTLLVSFSVVCRSSDTEV